MKNGTRKAKGREVRYLFVERPKCLVCGGNRLIANRSAKQSDGSVCRHSKCADCGERVRIILE